MPLEDVLAMQGDRPHKRRLHTQEPIRHVLKLCEARARLRAELRVETWQTAHDVANASLSMEHGVAKQAANELALKDVDKELFDQRISPAVVTISDEDGEIDILARSGI